MLNTRDTHSIEKSKHSPDKKTLKVLAIGNSFSEDSVEYLYGLAQDAGAGEVKIGNLVIGGCSLARHADNLRNNARAYSYQKNTAGTFVIHDGYSIGDGFKDEDWDVVTLQQASGYSGIPETYNEDLDLLIDYIDANKKKDAVIAWNMTWAYKTGSDHGDFAKYGNDQMKMYNAIVDTVKTKILPNKKITAIIPTGTAIENLRTSFIGDDVHRDGFHLSYVLGRYCAGMAWLKNLTCWDISNITYKPIISGQPDITPEQAAAIKEAVENSSIHPFSITESTYKVRDESPKSR